MSDASRKSDHKHEYEYLPIIEDYWTHERVCCICGYVQTKLVK